MKKGLALLLIIVLALVATFYFYNQRQREDRQNYLGTVASEAREVLRVTTIAGERTMPVHYRHKGKAAFGIGRYRVRIGFDIEQMKHTIREDTLFLRLPEPQIKILEHEQYGFRVLDVWGEDFMTRLTGAHLSLEEENAMKQKAISALRREIIAEGHLDHAKQQATDLLLNLFGVVPGTVVVLEKEEQRLTPSKQGESLGDTCPIDTRKIQTIKR